MAGVDFGWGATWNEVSAAVLAGQPWGAGHQHVGGFELRGLDVIDATLHAPAATRPVVGFTAAIASTAGFEHVEKVLGDWLGAPSATEHDDGARGGVRTRLIWDRFPAQTTCVEYVPARPVGDRGAVAGVFVHAIPEAFGEPFTEEFLAPDAPWMSDPGEAGEIVVVVGPIRALFPIDAPKPERLAARLAVTRPRLRDTPTWVRERLGADAGCVWAHPCGAWGLARREACVVLGGSAPPLRHHRAAPARGPGEASLDLADAGTLFETSPGPSGLDALVAECRRRGALVEVVETTDE